MTDETTVPQDPRVGTGRRCVLQGAMALGAAGLLSACGGGSKSDTATTDTGSKDTGSTGGGSTPAAGGTGGAQTVAVSKVPVGGGVVLGEKENTVVVTQPTAGTFKAFSGICTHQQCPVGDVSDGTINCYCHGSKFSITDGKVVRDPAPKPLTAMTAKVDGDTITVS